jgi:hypothetical protein
MKKYAIALSNGEIWNTTGVDEEDASETAYETLAQDYVDGIRIVSVTEVS